jgi:hypothetical protein
VKFIISAASNPRTVVAIITIRFWTIRRQYWISSKLRPFPDLTSNEV